MDHRQFRNNLVAWYRSNARDLPWRRNPTPYRVWVSEVMLQQTRVEAVRDYFTRFLKRFPTLRKLATANEEDVLQAWSGLGYYRRARMLHAAARLVADNHAGRLPSTPDELLALPGIGRYTAGAILSIAFDRPEPIVDGNVERVFARLNAANLASKASWEFARAHVQEGTAQGLRPSDLNQGLMELGATVCTPANPRCDGCPVRAHCRALETGTVEDYPTMKARVNPRRKRYLFAALRDDRGRVLLVRRATDDRASLLPGGLWELPHGNLKGAKKAALKSLAQQWALSLVADGGSSKRSHSIMNFKLDLVVQPCRPGADVPTTADCRWFTLTSARNAAIASATRKLLDAVDVPAP